MQPISTKCKLEKHKELELEHKELSSCLGKENQRKENLFFFF